MKKKFPIILSWCLVFACMGVIFYFSSQDGDESQALSDSIKIIFGIPVRVSVLRKIAHFVEFAALAALVFNAFRQTYGHCCPYLSFFITAAYAATDELHQLFVPGRAGMISDVFIDSLGAASAIGILMLIKFIAEKRRTV
ncbi:MAG: VanZ family protein [Clostridia bacterium]|nr:VanZ family protein [Clostridia bacterium]